MRYLLAAVLTVLVLTGLTGCDALQDMQGMFEKQEILQKIIRERHGWRTSVGWNMRNGRLTQVTVTFDAAEVAAEPVHSLVEAAGDAVRQTFKSTPGVIYVQVASRPGH